MRNELDMAVDAFKAALRNSSAYAEKPVILEKGKTLLVKTNRARDGKAIVNGR